MESAIPDSFPQKREIERRCLQLLEELGSDWFITIALEQRGRWGLAVGRFVPDRSSPVIRNVHVQPQDQQANGVIRLLHPRVEEIRRATNARFGMLPLTALSAELADDLHAWVRSMGGEVAEDGWVWLPERVSWPAFIERATQAGVKYVAEVR